MSDFCVIYECHECSNRWGDDHCRVLVHTDAPPNLPTHCIYNELDAIWRKVTPPEASSAPRPVRARGRVRACVRYEPEADEGMTREDGA